MKRRNEQDAPARTAWSALSAQMSGRPGSPGAASGPDAATMGKRAINVRAEEFGDLQRTVDAVFRSGSRASRLDLILQAEARDLHEDLIEIVRLLPPGTYTRQRMCDQLNSALAAHGWGRVYGTVE